jgi:hypothetical protein
MVRKKNTRNHNIKFCFAVWLVALITAKNIYLDFSDHVETLQHNKACLFGVVVVFIF